MDASVLIDLYLSQSSALQVAKAMRANDPFHITAEVLQRFAQQVSANPGAS